MPYALSMGVNYDEFWHLTPHVLTIIIEGYNIALKRQMERDNFIAYLQGAYTREALLSTVGNMLSDKHSKRFEYPDEPYDLNLDGRKEEREKEQQLELFTAQLTSAMANFNLSKKETG